MCQPVWPKKSIGCICGEISKLFPPGARVVCIEAGRDRKEEMGFQRDTSLNRAQEYEQKVVRGRRAMCRRCVPPRNGSDSEDDRVLSKRGPNLVALKEEPATIFAKNGGRGRRRKKAGGRARNGARETTIRKSGSRLTKSTGRDFDFGRINAGRGIFAAKKTGARICVGERDMCQHVCGPKNMGDIHGVIPDFFFPRRTVVAIEAACDRKEEMGFNWATGETAPKQTSGI